MPDGIGGIGVHAAIAPIRRAKALDQDAMGRRTARVVALSALCPTTPMERPMSQPFDASRSLTALEQDSTIIAAIEIAQSKWLVAAVVPGIKRQPLKKLGCG